MQEISGYPLFFHITDSEKTADKKQTRTVITLRPRI